MKLWSLALFLGLASCGDPRAHQEPSQECITKNCNSNQGKNTAEIEEKPYACPQIHSAAEGNCTPQYRKTCSEGRVYWQDSCGSLEEVVETCQADEICVGGSCSATKKLVYGSNRGGEFELYLQEGFRGTPAKLTRTLPGFSPLDPSFSPDGTKIAITLMQGNFSNIQEIDLTTRTSYQITNNSNLNEHPSYSPDGEWMVFSAQIGNDVDLFKIKRDGSGLTRLTSHPEADTEPAWCSNNLIFFRCDMNDYAELCKINPDGSGYQQLTSTQGAEASPACSPDGKLIAYACWGKPNADICLMDSEGKNVRRITTDFALDINPVFTLDGKLIIFNSYQNGNWDLMATDVETGCGYENLTATAFEERYPTVGK